MMPSLREPLEHALDTDSRVSWEECGCLLCGGHNWVPFVEAQDRSATGLWFLVVRCRDCGLCFTNPRPSEDTIADFYPADYAPHCTADDKRSHWWHRLPLLSSRCDRYRKALPLRGRGRLLDFGCGSGSFLLRMHRQGWQVTGLDTSEATVDRLRTDHNLHVLTGSLPHPALDEASFDAVTMWQALEHVHRPLDLLKAAHHVLAPGGTLLVAVPNIASAAFRWFGPAWNGLDLPRHLMHFDPFSLRLMLERTGFRVTNVEMVRRSGWLRDSARACTTPSRWSRLLRSKTLSNLASWYGYCTRRADCLLAIAEK